MRQRRLLNAFALLPPLYTHEALFSALILRYNTLMDTQIEQVVKIHNRLGESSLWDPRRQALYWVDIESDIFYQFDPKTGDVKNIPLQVPIFSQGIRAEGGLVVGTDAGFGVFTPDTGSFEKIVDLIANERGVRFNDGAVDPKGRFWSGTLDKDRTPTNRLYRLDPNRSTHLMVDDIRQSNGMGWSPDNKTFYLTDTRRQVIYAFDFDLDSGAIENRRVFIATPEAPEEGVPDGLTIDAEGFLWSARFRGSKLVRYDPQGKVEREVRLPVLSPASTAFGGANLDELYVSAADTGIWRLYPGVKGMAANLYSDKA